MTTAPRDVRFGASFRGPGGAFPRGEDHPWSVLTESAVLEIRELHARGESISAIARAYDVDRRTVRFIVRRQTWRHVPDVAAT